MKNQSALSDSFFAAFGMWQVVGTLSFFFEGILLIYLIGTVAFAALALFDRRTLLVSNFIKANYRCPQAIEKGEIFALTLNFEFVGSFLLKPKEIFWITPQIETVTFAKHNISLFSCSEIVEKGYKTIVQGKTKKIGYQILNEVSLQSISQWGIWSNSMTIKTEPIDFRVHPPEGKLKEVEFADKISKQQIFSSGMRKLLKSRAADQFHSIRKYQYPDPQRYIDAKKSAKYNQLMTRTFEEYRSHHLVLVLDTSRNLLGDLADSPKIDFYISACLKLMESALLMGDRVSLISFADQVRYLIKGARNPGSFQSLYRGNEVFQPSDREPNYGLLPKAISNVTGQRSIVFILTDPSMPGVHEEIRKNLFNLCQKHFVVVIGLNEKAQEVETFVMNLSSHNLMGDDVGRLIYNVHIEDQLEILTAQVNHWGGGVVRSDPENWIAMTKKAYGNLRTSLAL